MIYKLKLHVWMEQVIFIKETQETDLVLKPPYPKVKRWLKKVGYEL